MRAGGAQTASAIVVATITGLIIVLTTSEAADAAGRLALVGVLLFSFATLVGATRLVGVSSVVMFGAALIEAGSQQGQSWVRSIAIGCLWFLSLELAWDAIDRRDGGDRTVAVVVRQIQESATVVVISVLITAVGLAASTLSPQRTLVVQMAVTATLITVLVMLVRSLTAANRQG